MTLRAVGDRLKCPISSGTFGASPCLKQKENVYPSSHLRERLGGTSLGKQAAFRNPALFNGYYHDLNPPCSRL